MSDIVLKIENVSKQYRLGLIGTGTLSHDLNRWWHLARGKEDPYLKIGEVNNRSEKGGDYVWALKDINFEVKQGEVLGIIGKNGAGKSTLLKLLSQVTNPTTGQIKVKGRIAALLEVGTGFHPELTGRENIYLNGAILGMTKSEISSKFDEIVAFSGVEKYIDTPVKRYSSGMKVRLGFAVAAHLEPEILIVDEVLAVGDAEFQKKCLGKMKDVAGEGRTVLFVSHNMTAMTSLCNNAILLENGKLCLSGNVNEVVNNYLNNNREIKNSNSWKNNEGPGNDVARLCEVKLVDVNNEISPCININVEGYKIRFAFKVLKPIKNGMPQIHFFNNKKDCLFISYASVNNNVNSDKKQSFAEGVYSCSVMIPENLLNTGTCSVSIGFSDLDEYKLIFLAEDIINVEVLEDVNVRGISYAGTIGGMLRPALHWRIDKD